MDGSQEEEKSNNNDLLIDLASVEPSEDDFFSPLSSPSASETVQVKWLYGIYYIYYNYYVIILVIY